MQLPANAPTNGWFNMLPELPAAKRVSGTVRVPWVIVGAGLTGLSAARQLATHLPDQPIVLLEAERIGFGTSGRNSGFVLDSLFRLDDKTFDDVELAARHKRLCTGGLTNLKQLVTENQIECQWHDWGKLHVAAGPAGDLGLKGQQLGNDALGVPYRTLDRDEIESITGSRFYSWGVKTEGTALVNPAAMCRGLGRTLPANVTVYEDSPVHKLEKGSPARLITAGGEVVADQVILCTNVFSPTLGIAKSEMVPVVVYASLTRRMSDDECEHIGGDSGGFGLLPSAWGGSTVRRTQDGRILMRNSAGYGPGDTADPAKLAQARTNHYESIAKRWPGLRDVEIEYTWGGVLGITRNAGHVFGSIGTGLWASIACNGASVARGAMSGALLADQIVGNTSALLTDQMSLPRPSWLPPEPIRGFIGRHRIRRHLRDSSER